MKLDNKPHRIMHIISGLGVGGAETMLAKLVSQTDPTRFSTLVISLGTDGPIGKQITDKGIEVRTLELNPLLPNPILLLKLSKWIKEYNPSVIQTWMYHADLLGSITAWIAGNKNVIWNIRHSDFSKIEGKISTKLIRQISAFLSNWLPKKIVSNSYRGRDVHIDIGYNKAIFEVIPNGFDTELFKPDSTSRNKIRNELKINPDTKIIGMVGRFNEQKDYPNFIRAGLIVHETHKNIEFILCGKDVTSDNQALSSLIPKSAKNNFHLLGFRSDIPQLLNSLDIFSLSSSFGEAFPQVIGEAMATGLPCVSTDVGDSALIIGDTGFVVPIKDPQALAAVWKKLLDLDSKEIETLGKLARDRIVNTYSLNQIVEKYFQLYDDIGNQ